MLSYLHYRPAEGAGCGQILEPYYLNVRAGTISSVAELCNHSIFIRTKSSYLLLRFGTFNSFLAGLVGAEIKCEVHVDLPKLPD